MTEFENLQLNEEELNTMHMQVTQLTADAYAVIGAIWYPTACVMVTHLSMLGAAVVLHVEEFIQFMHFVHNVIFIPVNIPIKLIFSNIYMCVCLWWEGSIVNV